MNLYKDKTLIKKDKLIIKKLKKFEEKLLNLVKIKLLTYKQYKYYLSKAKKKFLLENQKKDNILNIPNKSKEFINSLQKKIYLSTLE